MLQQKAFVPLDQLLQLAKERQLECVTTQMSTPVHPNRRPIVSWTPPASSSYKVNFDKATFVEKGKDGLGAIIRNIKGLVMASLS